MGIRVPKTEKARLRRAIKKSQVQMASPLDARQAVDAVQTEGAAVASATTIDLRLATGALIEITGVTTITGFYEQGAGERRTTLFTGRLLLVHSTSLRLPNASNIVTVAGDIAEWISLGGGDWKCLSYVRGSGASVNAPSQIAGRLSGGSLASGKAVFDGTALTTVQWIAYNGESMTFNDAVASTFTWTTIGLVNPTLKLTNAISCTTTNGSATLTGSGFFSLIPLMAVSGTGISGGTTISSIQSDTSLTLSAVATTSATNTITFKVPINTNVDVYAVDTGTTTELRMVAWATDTTRVDTGLHWTQRGFFILDDPGDMIGSASLVSSATYLGTVRTTGTAGQTEDSTSKRYIWNAFNRRPRAIHVVDTTNTWNYSTASYQQANASAANQVAFVIGWSEDPVFARVTGNAVSSGATARLVGVGIGLDSTTVNSATTYDGISVTSAQRRSVRAEYDGTPGIGYHTLVWLEQGGGADTQSWFGDNGITQLQTGLVGTIWS
jgi:hypothetical protein